VCCMILFMLTAESSFLLILALYPTKLVVCDKCTDRLQKSNNETSSKWFMSAGKNKTAKIAYSLRDVCQDSNKALDCYFYENNTWAYDALKLMASQQRYLLFAGDSLTRHSYDFFIYDIERLSLRSFEFGDLLNNGRGDFERTLHFDGMNATIHHTDINILNDKNKGFPHLFKFISKIMSKRRDSVLILNYGMWPQYQDPIYFKKTSLEVLRKLSDIVTTTGKLEVIWRETTAQHFPTDTGAYDARIQNASSCVPLQNAPSIAIFPYWQNEIITDIIRTKHLRIHYLPFTSGTHYSANTISHSITSILLSFSAVSISY
jgi:hypothetical protein